MEKISAVIACYKDEKSIPYMYKRLSNVFKKINIDYEIIFVNDGSLDNTREILAGLASDDKRVIVINHSRNFGSQNAFTSGMKIASGEAIVLLDGDLQDPPELIEEFFKKWREGYDVVYGIRVKRRTTLMRQVFYKLFYRIFRLTSYLPIPLDAGDFSLLDRRVVNALNKLPEKNRYLRGLRAWVGFKQIGIEYTRPERRYGRSTNSLVRNLEWSRKAIISFSYMPIDFIVWLAFFTVAGSLLAMGTQLILRIFYPDMVPHGFTTLILLILLMGGIQLLCLGIIGSYLLHIYDEVKHRPPYIVESFLNYVPKNKESL